MDLLLYSAIPDFALGDNQCLISTKDSLIDGCSCLKRLSASECQFFQQRIWPTGDVTHKVIYNSLRFCLNVAKPGELLNLKTQHEVLYNHNLRIRLCHRNSGIST